MCTHLSVSHTAPEKEETEDTHSDDLELVFHTQPRMNNTHTHKHARAFHMDCVFVLSSMEKS